MKKFIFILLALILGAQSAQAASCSSYPFTLQNNTTADATQVMANFNGVRNCVINNAAGSGVNTDITSLTGLSTPLSTPQGGTPVFIGGTATGTAAAQVVATTVPIGFSLTSGYRVTYTASATNLTAATLNVNSTGATALRRPGHSGLEALTGGEVVSGNIIEAIYNGTFFVLLNDALSGLGTLVNLSSVTPDLGTVSTHNVNITGTTAITSFGSSAVVTDPVYNIKFAGALTLTYNATSLIIPGSGNITTATNDTAVVEYLGSGNWQVLSYTKRSGASTIAITPLCGAVGYTATNNAGTPNTNYDIAAGQAVMADTAGVTKSATAVAVTVNATTTGANGLDAGSLTTSSWYYAWLVNNGTTTAGLLSLSPTAPTMPSTYTYKCLMGAIQTDSSSNFLRTAQLGADSQYKITAATNTLAAFTVANGTTGTYSTTSPTMATATVRGNGFCAPGNATGATFLAANNHAGLTGSNVLVAPNTGWGGTNNGPTGSAAQVWPIYISNAAAVTHTQTTFNLEADTIATASDNTGFRLRCLGWRNPVNAN